MPATISSFNGTEFKIALQGISGKVQVTPYWPERNDQRLVGSVRKSITGRVSLQEMDRKWLVEVFDVKISTQVTVDHRERRRADRSTGARSSPSLPSSPARCRKPERQSTRAS